MTSNFLKSSTACLLLTATLLGSAPTLGATFHVSPVGLNTPPYDTYTKAAHRVKDAADLATAPGDTVLVHAGNYTSTDTIYIALGVTFAGVGRDSVTINWGDTESRPAIMTSLAGANDLHGLHFRYPLGTSFNHGIAALHAYTGQHILIHDCTITECEVYLDGDTWLPGDGVVEVYGNHFDYGQTNALFVGSPRCFIHDNLFTVSRSDGPGQGVYAWLAEKVVIENNWFIADEDQYDNPIAIVMRECDSGLVRNNLIRNSYTPIVWSETNGAIENNTMIHSDPDWFASLEVFQGHTDHVTIRNNVFVDMERPIAWGPQSGVDIAGPTTFVHNTFWPPRDTLYKMYPAGVSPSRFPVVESLNVFASPMFADESTHCPQAGSPLIDAGDPALADVDMTRSDIGWTGGPGGMECTYPQLPPLPPDSLWVSGASGLVSLIWSSRPEADLAEYRLYRGSSSGFWTPGMTPHRVLNPTDTAAIDTLLSAGDSYYYVVTARDSASLESQPSPEGLFITSGILDDPVDAPIPRTPYIARVYPNPFNAATTMEVFIPDVGAMPAPVRIRLYDVMGRLVSVPFEGSLTPGNHAIPISATDAQGHALASGVYFARLRVWGTEFGGVKKLVVLK